jgi:hypothetical protein
MKLKHLVLIIIASITLIACGLVPLFSFVAYNNSQATTTTANTVLVER